MINPYLIIALLIAWAGSMFGVGIWQRHDGALSVQTAWQTRENAEHAATAIKIKTLEDAARQAEQDHQTALVAISTTYQKELTDANKQHDADIAAVHAGTLRLHDPNPPGLRTIGCIPGQTTTGTGGRDGEAGGELSDGLAELLITEADRADDYTRQLAACQQIAIEDRAGQQ